MVEFGIRRPDVVGAWPTIVSARIMRCHGARGLDDDGAMGLLRVGKVESLIVVGRDHGRPVVVATTLLKHTTAPEPQHSIDVS